MGRHRYEDLEVYKKSVDLAVEVSLRTRKYPDFEKFSLVTQTNRAVYSISNNIAEGAGRGGNPEFRNFLYYSLGSLNEVENELLLALRLAYLEEIEYQGFKSRTEIIKKMLINLIKAL
ncbi:four helix bundle protein [Algoriphagus pacificus]|uniref:Four helix bundle protein n=1 Tax=Algoriphagus pacificus TaxID=2811234 RepID=A0ABS3CH76_9BACT|nr:four helix bundle protein [Algoriphagus pacificus]MBN7814989.1 four helix bundle protein [Algoriphagus pacificus]